MLNLFLFLSMIRPSAGNCTNCKWVNNSRDEASGLQWVTVVVGHRARWDRVGSIAMDRANAVMTRHRELEDLLD